MRSSTDCGTKDTESAGPTIKPLVAKASIWRIDIYKSSGDAEADIIAWDGDEPVIVEVKTLPLLRGPGQSGNSGEGYD